MPKKKIKYKLSPEQEAQEIARKEIEEMLNLDIGGRKSEIEYQKSPACADGEAKSEIIKPAIKAGVISVRKEKQTQQSPYLVDLKKSLEKEEKKKKKFNPADKFKFEQRLESLSSGAKGILSKTKNIKKSWPKFKKELIREREVKEEIKKGKKVARAISETSQGLSRVETPMKVALQSLWISKKLAAVWKFYLADAGKWVNEFYQKHLQELLIANAVALIVFITYKILSAIYKALYSFGQTAGSVALIFLKPLFEVFARLLKYFYGLSKKLVYFAYLIMKQSGKKAVAMTKQAGKQTKDIKQKAVDKIDTIREQVEEKTSEAVETVKSEIRPRRFSLKFLSTSGWARQMTIFIIIIFTLSTCFKILTYVPLIGGIQGKVLGASEEAVDSLQLAAQSGGRWDFMGAADNFSQAAVSFSLAQDSLSEVNFLTKLLKFIPWEKAQLAAQSQDLLSAGEGAAKIGEYLALAFNALQLDEDEPNLPLSKRLDEFFYYNQKTLRELNRFSETIAKINPELFDPKLAVEIEKFQEDAPTFIDALQEINRLTEVLQIFLGKDIDTRYLIIFQNNAEMRATGGFIGSYALVDFSEGEIKSMEVPGGGSYDLQGGLQTRVASPQPLHLINSLWEFQDANWWPDWPKSADKIAWFFENGWGSSVDGVIAITPTFVEELLDVIGPIDLTEKYGEVINSNNFYDIVQKQAENKKTDKPKEIISDLFETLVAELPSKINKDNFIDVIKVIEKAMAEKHILLNFSNETLQNLAAEYNWDGRIKKVDGDYLMVVNSNIAGGKSDRKIKQTIYHQAKVMPDNSIINTVTIKREHQAYPREPFAGVRNVNYMRVYVPKGSILLEASGFSEPDEIYFDEPAEGAVYDDDIYVAENITKIEENSGVRIYNEFNKTVFAHWTQIDPGQTIETKFKYKLPFKLEWPDENKSKYLLYIQKQAGTVNTSISTQLVLPPGQEIVWDSAFKGDMILDNDWSISDNLDTDKYLGVIIEK